SHLAFSPVCRCPSATAHIGVRLRDAQELAVDVVDDDGQVVRRLLPARRVKAIGIRWDGRTDGGKVAPDGTYRFRLDLPHRTVVMPNPVRLDTTPPHVRVSVTDRVFSPDGDSVRDRVGVRYQSNEQLFDVRLVVTGPSGRHVVRAGRRRSA